MLCTLLVSLRSPLKKGLEDKPTRLRDSCLGSTALTEYSRDAMKTREADAVNPRTRSCTVLCSIRRAHAGSSACSRSHSPHDPCRMCRDACCEPPMMPGQTHICQQQEKHAQTEDVALLVAIPGCICPCNCRRTLAGGRKREGRSEKAMP